MLSRIRIVLIETSHPGNVGAVARGMKTMGLEHLYLVNPKCSIEDAGAVARASGAQSVLQTATVCSSLDAALEGCQFVAGSSSRNRHLPWPQLLPRACAQKIKALPEKTQVAILFGRESSGLTNEELASCQVHVHIPSNPEYPSLNLGAAVQVLAYEMRLASLEGVEQPEEDPHLPVDSLAMARFFEHLDETLAHIDFMNPKASQQKLKRRLKRLFHRAAPDEREMQILRGILTAVQKEKT